MRVLSACLRLDSRAGRSIVKRTDPQPGSEYIIDNDPETLPGWNVVLSASATMYLPNSPVPGTEEDSTVGYCD